MLIRVLAGGLLLVAAVVSTGCGPGCSKCLPTRTSAQCCPPQPCCPPAGGAVLPAAPPTVAGFPPAYGH
jgi:hypothetical protein